VTELQAVEHEVLVPLNRPDAEKLDGRIRRMADTARGNLETVGRLLDEAKAGQVHQTLGFKSWTVYVADAVGGQLQLSGDARAAMVGLLAGEGMSVRAIAEATGVSKSTVSRDMEQVSHNGTPQSGAEVIDNGPPDADDSTNPAEAVVDAIIAEAREQCDMSDKNIEDITRRSFEQTEQKITGRDGKTYTKPKPQPKPQPKPRVKPVDQQRNMISRIGTKLTDSIREANSLLRADLDDGITAEEASRQADALNSQLQPILQVYELLLKRAVEPTPSPASMPASTQPSAAPRKRQRQRTYRSKPTANHPACKVCGKPLTVGQVDTHLSCKAGAS
jgi:transposase